VIERSEARAGDDALERGDVTFEALPAEWRGSSADA
jgi:hypothetical protein